MEINEIDRLGGPTKVADLLGWKGQPGAVQRISNWKVRGIPPRILLKYPEIFSGATDGLKRLESSSEAA